MRQCSTARNVPGVSFSPTWLRGVLPLHFTANASTPEWFCNQALKSNLFALWTAYLPQRSSAAGYWQHNWRRDPTSLAPTTGRDLRGATPAIRTSVCLLKVEMFSAAKEEEARMTQQLNASVTTISVETDTRHARGKNSYYTDVLRLGQRTHKVVGMAM